MAAQEWEAGTSVNDGIDWREVGSGGRFEKIVSVLLSSLHPTSMRIDGSGGDGGRDHQLHIDGRLDVWQSKYFMGRLSDAGGRKGQIERSLVKAAELQPDHWFLVTPMDPTPEEGTAVVHVIAGELPISFGMESWCMARSSIVRASRHRSSLYGRKRSICCSPS
jgi:hypothetical protein